MRSELLGTVSFSFNLGCCNEQITMVPLEKQILKDFELARSKLTVCVDDNYAIKPIRFSTPE